MNNTSRETGNLRLPVPFFDLLMALLVSFLVFVAPPEEAATRNLDLPIAHGGKKEGSENLLVVLPRRGPDGWSFETPVDGRKFSPDALATHIRASGRKVVIVAPATTALQDFIDIQTALRDRKIDFGLAVRDNKENKP